MTKVLEPHDLERVPSTPASAGVKVDAGKWNRGSETAREHVSLGLLFSVVTATSAVASLAVIELAKTPEFSGVTVSTCFVIICVCVLADL